MSWDRELDCQSMIYHSSKRCTDRKTKNAKVMLWQAWAVSISLMTLARMFVTLQSATAWLPYIAVHAEEVLKCNAMRGRIVPKALKEILCQICQLLNALRTRPS